MNLQIRLEEVEDPVTKRVLRSEINPGEKFRIQGHGGVRTDVFVPDAPANHHYSYGDDPSRLAWSEGNVMVEKIQKTDDVIIIKDDGIYVTEYLDDYESSSNRFWVRQFKNGKSIRHWSSIDSWLSGDPGLSWEEGNRFPRSEYRVYRLVRD